jgi:cell wall-associated NlpC family hydrolase
MVTKQRRAAVVVAVVVVAGAGLLAAGRTQREPAVRAAPLAAPAAAPAPTPAAPAVAATPVADASGLEGDSLPVDSPYDLPPMLLLRSAGGGSGTAAALRRAVLRSRALVPAPSVRRDITAGRVSADLLRLLEQVSHVESPVLVHRARGATVRVQATSLDGTRKLVRALTEAGTATVALEPVRRDFADLEQSASDARASDVGPKVTRLALAQVGIPYSWGGGNAGGASRGTCDGYRGSIRPCPATRTVGFDCSGLMLYAYAQVGITLDHYAAFQWLEGRRIAATDLMPGDLVFFHPKRDGPGHVGMYVGTGRFVHAPRTGDVVKVSPLADYAGSYMGAVRPA